MNIRPVSPPGPCMARRDDRHGLRIGAARVERAPHRGRLRCSTAYVAEVDGRAVGCALINEVDGDTELVGLVSTYRGAGRGHRVARSSRRAGPAGRLEAALARDEQRQHRGDPDVPARGLGLGRLPARRDHAARGRSSPRSPTPAITASRSATKSCSRRRSNLARMWLFPFGMPWIPFLALGLTIAGIYWFQFQKRQAARRRPRHDRDAGSASTSP